MVLAANDLPSINDVTYPELLEIISKVIKTFIDVLLGIHLFANACLYLVLFYFIFPVLSSVFSSIISSVEG